jgi:hypothetical protein
MERRGTHGWLFSDEGQQGKEEGFSIHVSDDPDDYEFEGEWPPTPRAAPAWLWENFCPLIVLARWKFHKTDVDPWPSLLHGHHSQRPLKLDAITGEIFNIHTRERVQKMKPRELARVQAELLDSKDFSERARSLFGA